MTDCQPDGTASKRARTEPTCFRVQEMGMGRRDAFMHFGSRQKQRAGPKSRAGAATGLFLAFCAQLLQAF
jgi:hypothetical protein